ncbi:MAG: bifunctional metallophosphatase/5'-nucleotidase [Erysipelotrichia bacterium]|nr:bifunctional metallophosphatase/5'-nucleotidase [Erysipelotrichia bacterium]
MISCFAKNCFSSGRRLTMRAYIIVFLGLLLVGVPECVTAEEINFTILHTSDEHSSLLPAPLSEYLPGKTSPAVGGVARLATLVKQVREQKKNEPVLLLSSGDFSGGTPFAWLALKGQSAEIELMQKIGYAATVAGNHEFDYGPAVLADYFLRHQRSFATPQIVSSNLVVPTGHRFDQVKINRHLILSLAGGLKIGILGLMGKAAHRLSPAAAPLDFSDQHTAARREIAALKDAGADVIVALTHAGYYEDVALGESVEGIHLILGGHDHITLDPPKLAGSSILMHSGSYLQTLGQLDLAFDRGTGKLRLRNHETQFPFLRRLDSGVAEDPEIAAIVDRCFKELNQLVAGFTDGAFDDMHTAVARSDFALLKHQTLCETTIGDFIADAIRLETEKVVGQRVDFAMHANGIIRGGINPSTIAASAGEITLFDLVGTCGLGAGADGEPGYPLVSFYLTGAEILNLLEVATLLPILWNDVYFLQFSGLRYRYDPERAVWFWLPFINKPLPAYRSILQVERFTGNGPQHGNEFVPVTIGDTALYHVATTHYMASYLPMVGKKLPRLNLVLKDRFGRPVELNQTIVKLEGREFKLWEAAARYICSFEKGGGDLPVVPPCYRSLNDRITVADGPSLWLQPVIVVCIVAAVVSVLFWWRRRKARRK